MFGPPSYTTSASTLSWASLHSHAQNGRHPLQELVADHFIPNDFHVSTFWGVRTQLEPDSPSLEILTGPNSSGKSVYLKQLALLVYLAQIGCFVPAERASLCLFHSIHTKFNTIERWAARSRRS